MYDYGREIYQELQSIDNTLKSILAFLTGDLSTWMEFVQTSLQQFWDVFYKDFFPVLWMIPLFLGTLLVIKLFFPRWGGD